MRTPSEITSEMLARYFAGTATDTECGAIEARMTADPAWAREVATLKRMWDVAGERTISWNVDAGWDATRARLLAEERERQSRGRADRRPVRSAANQRGQRSTARPQSSRRLVSVLALVLFLAAGAIAYVALRSNPSGSETWSDTYVTAPGERVSLELDDGTTVQLNVDSRLSIADGFGEQVRVVSLQGEAYFDVAHDTRHPFIVRTARGTVEVVGTAFVVSSYENESEHVVVTDGFVRFAPEGIAVGDVEMLDQGDVATLAGGRLDVRRDASRLGQYLGWLEGRLVFDETPFEQVCTRLERWYDLEITSSVPPSEVGWLNATLSEEPVEEVLEIVTTALGLEYERSDDQVTFFRN